MDLNLALMCGIDIPIPECGLILHQPTLQEIAFIGEEKFYEGLTYLCLNKKNLIQDKSALETTNNFQIFMKVMQEKEAINKKASVRDICSLFFPSYKLNFTANSMILLKDGELSTIDENNFEAFQKVIMAVGCIKNEQYAEYNPGNAEAEKIAAKLIKGRQRIAAERSADNANMLMRYISTLSIVLGIIPLEIIKLTIFQLYDLIERYDLYVNWDINIRAKLAGSTSDEKPEDWMKNIH